MDSEELIIYIATSSVGCAIGTVTGTIIHDKIKGYTNLINNGDVTEDTLKEIIDQIWIKAHN